MSLNSYSEAFPPERSPTKPPVLDAHQGIPAGAERVSSSVRKILLLCSVVVSAIILGVAQLPPPVAETPGDRPRTYKVRGLVKSVDLPSRTAEIQHEEIPGYMLAMTMPFYVKEAADLEKLTPESAIEFDLVVTKDDSWITKLVAIDRASLRLPKPKGVSLSNLPPAVRIREGDLLPDFHLVDQAGKQIDRSAFEGNNLVLTFIFTRCPIPNFCPRISDHFGKLQASLSAHPELNGKVKMLSVSIDPEFDTPEILQKYAARFKHDPSVWSFATGSADEVAKLTAGFAVYVKPESGTLAHGLCTVLIDEQGAVRNIWRGNQWEPNEVLEALRQNPKSTL